mmetsp:Transcript_8172/g.25175  ORF Transcript_8172/g.25175 Transcript_8172/m.25175 type:complete len:143 (-) Transcript_8172:317-745(-)
MLRAALARRCKSALAPALASPFASSARATVAEVSVPFTVVGLDGARHRCVGREGHNLVKGMQQAKLPLALMGVNGYDAALRLPREWHDKVPEMDLAQKSKLMELTYHNMDDARLASQVKLTKELANVEVALIKPMLQDNNPP